MIEKTKKEILENFKEEVLKYESIIGMLHSSEAKELESLEKSSIDKILILLSEKSNKDKIKDVITSKMIENDFQVVIHSMDDTDPENLSNLHEIFRKGNLLYWKSGEQDFPASQVFKIKPYTIFIFDLSRLEQKEKVRFNYKLYGKKMSGILSEWDGKRITKSCFYVPYSNRYKSIRFLSHVNIPFQCMEIWM